MKTRIPIYLILLLVVTGFFPVPNLHSKNLKEEDKLILVGHGAFQDGFYEIAEKQFTQFVKEFPNHERVNDVSYLLGRTLLVQKKLKEAKMIFSKIVNSKKIFDQMDYALFWLAVLEVQLGEFNIAKTHLLNLIQRYPKFEWVDYSYYLLGHIDFASNQFQQAESHFKKVTQLSHKTELLIPSLFWLGLTYFKQKDLESAVSHFEKVLDGSKSLPNEYLKFTLFWLGKTYFKLGQWEEAKSRLKMFIEKFKENPLLPEAYWRIGYCEYRLGNMNEAIGLFQSFKTKYKDSPLLTYTYFFIGEILREKGEFASSIKEIHTLLNNPQGRDLWGMGMLQLYWNHTQLGEMGEANKVSQKLQKLTHAEDEKIFLQWLNSEMAFLEGNISDSIPYYFNILNTRYREKALFKIGKGYFFENKFRDAITNIDILSLEFPNSSYLDEALFIKGESYYRLGHFEQALAVYQSILMRQRNDIWTLFALTQMGNLYFSRNEMDKSEKAFKRVMEVYPNHALYFNAAVQLGNLYLKKKNIGDALHYYSIVLKGNVLDLLGQAHFGLGEIFYYQEKYEKAFYSFQTAIRYLKEKSPWFFLAQLEIGILQMKWGKEEEARKSWMFILDHSKDEEVKKAAKDLLNRLDSH
jgi:TolA-binding protein